MRALERFESQRLLFHQPRRQDADEIFHRYASAPEVTHFLAWPRHDTLADTQGFLQFSDQAWQKNPAGPYLVRCRRHDTLLGSTGLDFEGPNIAATGYVFAKDAWGQGYATESLRAMVGLARQLDVERLYAHCHAEHDASRHVLEKAGFACEGILAGHMTFPNLAPATVLDVVAYGLNPMVSTS